MAIELNNYNSMNNLGIYYDEIKDYKNMIKYYSMAIELNNDNTMNNLGIYYDEIKDFENMINIF